MRKFLTGLILFFVCGLSAFCADYNLQAIKLYNLGLEQYRIGAYSAAISYFKEAIEIQNDFYDAYYNMAIVYDYVGNYTEAIMILESLLTKIPEDSAAVYKLAQIYHKKGDAQKALELLQEIAPTSAEFNQAQSLVNRIKLEHKAVAEYAGKDIAAKSVPVSAKIKNINAPSGIGADLNGNIYVASFTDNAVFKIKENGIHQLYFKNDMLNGPIGLVFDARGNMYIANYNKNNILKLDKYGNPSIFIEYSNKPYYLFVRENVLYISEQGTNTVTKHKLF